MASSFTEFKAQEALTEMLTKRGTVHALDDTRSHPTIRDGFKNYEIRSLTL
jgi:hypothetical protein